MVGAVRVGRMERGGQVQGEGVGWEVSPTDLSETCDSKYIWHICLLPVLPSL